MSYPEGPVEERRLSQAELGRRSYDTLTRIQAGLFATPSYLAALHRSFFDVPYEDPGTLDDRVVFDVSDSRYLATWSRKFRSSANPSSGIQLKLVIEKFEDREQTDYIEVRSNFSLSQRGEPTFSSGGARISQIGGPYEDTPTAYKKIDDALGIAKGSV